MDKFNNKDLDALFQEGSERYDFTYREDAWASMNEMLDDREKKRNRGVVGWWLLAGIAVMVGIFGVKQYGANQSVPPLRTDSVNAPSAEAGTATVLSATGDLTEKEVSDQTATEKITTERIDPVNNLAGVDAAANLTTETILNPVENNNPVSVSNNEAIKVTVKPKQQLTPALLTQTSTSGTKDLSESTSEITPAKAATVIEEETVMLPSGILTVLPEKSVAYRTNLLPVIELTESEKNPDAGKPKLANRFSVGLSIGPEFSFVGGFGEAKAGYYLGLEVGYQLNKHFELITGVGVSKKKYLGSGSNYKAGPGFWTDEIVPMEFSSKCTVIEIPLALNYYFNDAKENGWFASLGATTYLMSNEWYDFIYDPAITRSDLKANWNGQMENNHLLGVGQVSFGYQRNFGKHTSLQISPYAKIPLTGIGTGSVNLFSTGVRVTARFR